jgi:hypothetical protein
MTKLHDTPGLDPDTVVVRVSIKAEASVAWRLRGSSAFVASPKTRRRTMGAVEIKDTRNAPQVAGNEESAERFRVFLAEATIFTEAAEAAGGGEAVERFRAVLDETEKLAETERRAEAEREAEACGRRVPDGLQACASIACPLVTHYGSPAFSF